MTMPRFLVPLALTLTVALTGCGVRPQPSALAACMVSSADKAALIEAGTNSFSIETNAATLGRFQAAGCEGAAAFALNSEYRQEVSKAFIDAAAGRQEFRSASYALLPGVQSEKAMARARELGSFLEDVFVTRRSITQCQMADAQAIAAVAELDATFTLAVLGRYVGVTDFKVAQADSGLLIDRVASSGEKLSSAACDSALDARFRGQVAQWALFYEGKHPWAPGCSVKAESDAFLLKCQ